MKMKSFSVCKKRYYAEDPFYTAYRTVPRLNNTVPYRLALLLYFLYCTVSRRDGTVRCGISTAYRQSLHRTKDECGPNQSLISLLS